MAGLWLIDDLPAIRARDNRTPFAGLLHTPCSISASRDCSAIWPWRAGTAATPACRRVSPAERAERPGRCAWTTRRALPTYPQQEQQKTSLSSRDLRFDHAASPMPETRQPERLAPRATSSRNGGRDHLGILGEIKSVHPGEIIGIRTSMRSRGTGNAESNSTPRWASDTYTRSTT